MTPYEYATYLLKNFDELKMGIANLKFEFNNFEDEELSETIQSLTFRNALDNDKVQTSNIMDITASITENYIQENSRVNTLGKSELALLIKTNERELNRLEHCVSTLPEQLSAIIQGLYFDKKTWDQICYDEMIARTTLQKRRDNAINMITKMIVFTV